MLDRYHLKQHILPSAILIIVCILIYSNTLEVPFVFDDRPNIVKNESIRIDDIKPESIIRAASNNFCKNRPVAYITFAINYYLGIYDVKGYHLVNISVHVINSMLLFYLFRMTLVLIYKRKGDMHDHSISCIAFAAALIWLVHPLHTQSVTYIVQRMTSLCSMFFLGSMISYITARFSAKSLVRYALFSLCILSGMLSMMTKENAATLPVFIFLYEWYFIQDQSVKWIKQRCLIIIPGIAVFLLIVLLYLGINPVERIMADYSQREFTPVQRIMTQWRVIMHYIGLMFYPDASRLNLDYHFALSYSLFKPVTTILSLIAIITMVVMAIYLVKKELLISFSILWFLGNLAIESSIIPLELVYEHRTYLPSMFPVLALTVFADRYIRKYRIKIAAVLIIAAVCSYWTYERNELWGDRIAFWEDCIEKSPDKARPHFNMGLALSGSGKKIDAIKFYEKTIEIDPDFKDAHKNIGYILFHQGRIKESIPYFIKVLTIDPDDKQAIENLANALLAGKEYKKSMTFFAKLIRIDPDNAQAYHGIGYCLASKGRIDEALRFYERSISINADNAETHLHLGISLARKRQYQEALRRFSEAIRIRPNYTEAFEGAGTALYMMHRYRDSIRFFNKALANEPDSESLRNKLNEAKRMMDYETKADSIMSI